MKLVKDAIKRKDLSLWSLPTTLRRCLQCESWMRSTGPDHRLCNPCKGDYYYSHRVGSRVKQ
jgi:hypothetical protein